MPKLAAGLLEKPPNGRRTDGCHAETNGNSGKLTKHKTIAKTNPTLILFLVDESMVFISNTCLLMLKEFSMNVDFNVLPQIKAFSCFFFDIKPISSSFLFTNVHLCLFLLFIPKLSCMRAKTLVA